MQAPSQQTCPKCGGLLEKTPSGDLGCMSCLLRAGIGSEGETVHESTPDPLEGGVLFGVYEIDRREDGSLYELGRGAMGVTYRATDTSLQRKVALKIIKTEIAERSDDARERFMREARAAAALRHENVATVYQFGMRLETGQYFYAMELIEGETLDERVRRTGPLDARTTVGIAQQVTSALAAAEKRGLIHRDLKPANLMLLSADEDEVVAMSRRAVPTVKIIDFGLAKAVHAEIDPKSLTHDRFVGTPAFASPEQFEHSALDVRSDIYSLGGTLWFALTGRTPFSGRTMEEIHRAQKSNALPIEQLKTAYVPSRLRSLLESMLAFEPAARPGIHYLAAQLRVHQQQDKRTRAPKNSVAVLPFENLSVDPENAFFAGGVHAEILTHLAKLAGLKVISRTSVMTYERRGERNLREIAKELGVAHLVQGSVQRAGDQVRVNVQLIKAQTDSHLWAETYDRKLIDIFLVESDIAKRIAESLQAKLTRREEQALAASGIFLSPELVEPSATISVFKPTNNLEAYDAYLRGLALEARKMLSFDAPMKTVDFYERAVQLDPNFALAWARLSGAHAYVYFIPLDTTAARRDAARKALENAQKLAPDSPETLLALGHYQYFVLRDYGIAKSTFALVSKMLPSSSEAPKALGYIARREGKWDESIAYFEQALVLDPCNVELLMEAAWTHTGLRQFPAALKLYDRTLDITPNDPARMAEKAGIYQAEGNLQEAAKLLSETNAQTPSAIAFLIKMTEFRLERNLGEAIRLLQARLTQFRHPSEIEKINNQLWLALTQRLNGDTAGANVTAAQACNTLEPLCKNQPDNAALVAGLSLANAVLGEKALALKEAERAITLSPSIQDHVRGPAFEEILAFVETMVGENSRAISTLTRLLQTPYSSWLYIGAVTAPLLRLDPLWDSLRGDPAFQKLCEEKQP
jgi:serine/threonine protein kinase/Tfp pilus assembly protein PilF